MDFVSPFRHTGELNAIERLKLERHPLEVQAAVRSVYAIEGAAAIARVEGEAERLKWVGLYPQRQGGNAFMLRVKIPGGRLSATQARRIGEIVERHARGPAAHPKWGDRYCDLTTRQDIQLHWVRIEDVPRIWDQLEDVGLTSVQACGDSARNVLCCPLAGLDAEEAFDASPVADAISAYFTGNREYANLPRKFKLSVTGCLEDCAQAEINDVGMLPARGRDGRYGFNLFVGGGLSDGARMASDIDVFVGLDQAVECTRAIAQVFGELGNRENRGLSRMRYLVQELGPEGFRAALVARARCELEPAGESLTRRYRGDHVGVHAERRAGRVSVGCSVTVGRLRGEDLIEAARIAEAYGDGGLRLATDQNLIFTGIGEEHLDAALGEELFSRHSPFPGPFSRGVVACTGNEFCRFAIVETKARAQQWAERLDAEFAEHFGGPAGSVDRPETSVVRMHFSGCSASCAQPQIADIGFRGETAHVGDMIVEAVDIALGGSLGAEAAFGDWIVGALPVDDVPAALHALVGRHVAERRGGERFTTWVRRRSPLELRAALEGQRDEGQAR
ncbi:MAG: ferredoxin--nitrite reductase [Actinomycetota bacterium]|nr:ferredoxin--nitrite reductase [Actinomycetota bacterium]